MADWKDVISNLPWSAVLRDLPLGLLLGLLGLFFLFLAALFQLRRERQIARQIAALQHEVWQLRRSRPPSVAAAATRPPAGYPEAGHPDPGRPAVGRIEPGWAEPTAGPAPDDHIPPPPRARSEPQPPGSGRGLTVPNPPEAATGRPSGGLLDMPYAGAPAARVEPGFSRPPQPIPSPPIPLHPIERRMNKVPPNDPPPLPPPAV